MSMSAIRLVVPGLAAVALGVWAIIALNGGGSTPVVDAQVPFAAEDAQTVSAIGTGQVAAVVDSGYSLSVGVEERTEGNDVQAAVDAAQAKVDAIKAALQGAGIPADDIVVTNFNISPNWGYPPMPVPADAAGAPGMSRVAPEAGGQNGYIVSANMQVDTANADQLAEAMQAAIDAGATSVGTWGKGGPEAPPTDAAVLKPAIEQATEQAKTMAEASAAAAGVDLGGIHSVSVQPPMAIYTGPGPGASYWQVQVKVTYDIEP
jgi:uncharacterized protein YggE